MSAWLVDVSAEATPEEKARALRDTNLAIEIGVAIEAEYPGHRPFVRVDSWGGIFQVAHPLLPQGWGVIVKLSTLMGDPDMKCAKDAFGECLERFYLPRGARRSDLWEEASRKYHKVKHGILKEVNWKTGETKFILPQELAR